MDDRGLHFHLFGEDGLGELESGQRGIVHAQDASFHSVHLDFRLQLFHSNLGMVSHHSEIKDRPFPFGNIEELVLFTIGEVPAGEDLGSSRPGLLL